MIGRGPIGQAIGIARRDVQRIQDAQTVLQIADAGRQSGEDNRRQIPAGAPEAVAPRLLAMAQVQTLQGLLHLLVASKAGPFMVAGGGADSGQGKIGLCLMQPVEAAVHRTIVSNLAVAPLQSRQRKLSASVAASVARKRLESEIMPLGRENTSKQE